MPEQTPTINDGTNNFWTVKYTYTDFDAVYQKTDARGVVTTYTFDTLNRLTDVNYNVGASGAAATGAVHYTYDTNQASATNGQLLSVSVANSNGVGIAYQASYSYEGFAQVSAVTYTIG